MKNKTMDRQHSFLQSAKISSEYFEKTASTIRRDYVIKQTLQ